jgi:hypothetical protein
LARVSAAKSITSLTMRACQRISVSAGGDPAEIGAWINEAKAERVQADVELRQATSKTRITRDQIEALIASLRLVGEGLPSAKTE